jgi:hypothetical protein
MYYNSLRAINSEFSQHGSIPRHLMSRRIFPLKNNSKNYRKIYFFKLAYQLQRNKDVFNADLYFLSLLYLLKKSILIVFVSIISHLKSRLTKNYIISSLFYTIFSFLVSCQLLFP